MNADPGWRQPLPTTSYFGWNCGRAVRRVVLGAADIGDELAGLVVERDERAVVDVLVRGASASSPRRSGRGPRRLRRRSLAFGTKVAALTHFSAIFWRSMSSVVVIRRPPFSRASQVGTSSPHSLVASSFWTAQTKCGAIQLGVCCGARTTFSSLAARKSAASNCPADSGFRSPSASRSRIWFRRWTISVSSGTTSVALPGQVPSSSTATSHSVDRVQDEVVVRRRLRQPGEDRRLGDRQVVELLAEVRLGRGLDPVALVAVVVLVEVGGDDLLLALARPG